MTSADATRAMAARLAAIDWGPREYRTWSQAALLKEYLRRVARWANAYDCAPDQPFFDLAACVNPTVRADQRLVDEVRSKMDSASYQVRSILPNILHWAAVRPTLPTSLPAGLEDPFEPLILLLERGGAFYIENGEVMFELLSVPVRRWRFRADDPPMASFDSADLDEIDRAGSIRQLGYVVEPDD